MNIPRFKTANEPSLEKTSILQVTHAVSLKECRMRPLSF